MIKEQENVFQDYKSDDITLQEELLEAVRDLKHKYKKELKRIKKNKQSIHLSQSEVHEQTQKILYYYESLLEKKKKCKKNELQDINDQVIHSVSITQKQNYLIKTEKGTYYQCKCHNKLFQTNQQLGGHKRKLK